MKHAETQTGRWNIHAVGFSVCQPSTCWSLTCGNLASCQSKWQSARPAALADCYRKTFFPFFGQNLNSKSYCFPTSSNYDLQLPSEFRLCNIIIVSESQTWQPRDSRDEINSFPRLRRWWGSYRGPEFHLELSGLPELMDWVQKRYQGYWKEFQLKTELFTASAEGIFYQSVRIFCQSIECL